MANTKTQDAVIAALQEAFTPEQLQDVLTRAAGIPEVTPDFDTDPELVAAAKLLFEAGRKVKATRDGREKHVLGDKDGVYPYRVTVTLG